MSKRRRVWRVTGFDGTRETLRFDLPAYAMSEGEMATLLQKLVTAAKGLYQDEFEAALAEAASGLEVATLRVWSDLKGGDVTLRCGDNPHYTAARY